MELLKSVPSLSKEPRKPVVPLRMVPLKQGPRHWRELFKLDLPLPRALATSVSSSGRLENDREAVRAWVHHSMFSPLPMTSAKESVVWSKGLQMLLQVLSAWQRIP